jgi:hypothetical protein
MCITAIIELARPLNTDLESPYRLAKFDSQEWRTLAHVLSTYWNTPLAEELGF